MLGYAGWCGVVWCCVVLCCVGWFCVVLCWVMLGGFGLCCVVLGGGVGWVGLMVTHVGDMLIQGSLVTFPSARLLTILAVCCSIDARADLLASMRTRNYGSMNQLPSFYNMTDCRSTDALLFLYFLDPHLYLTQHWAIMCNGS